jgi:myo-inositol-1-phosphate synthase
MPPLNKTNEALPQASASNIKIRVDSETTQYTEEHILSKYQYRNSTVTRTNDGQLKVTPTNVTYHFKTELNTPKVG